MDGPGRGLTEFQLEVARLFFTVPASATFLLAGGGALLAHGLGHDRPRIWTSSPVPVAAT